MKRKLFEYWRRRSQHRADRVRHRLDRDWRDRHQRGPGQAGPGEHRWDGRLDDSRPEGGYGQRGQGVRRRDAQARPRVDRRLDLRRDGSLRLGVQPGRSQGTSDDAAAAKDESGQPVSNGARNIWVTESALATALNVAFFAERVAFFTIAMGIMLLLTGIGFLVLTIGGALRRGEAAEALVQRPISVTG
jgi:hypothetical protein